MIAEPSVLAGQDRDREGGGTCHLEDGPALAGETARRLACDATVVEVVEAGDGTVLDVGRRTRRINRRLRRALRRRDGHCRYPGCRRRVVEGHHIRHWIEGGPTSLSNLAALCARHHHRLHEGGYRLRVLPGGALQFVHPEGWVIPEICDPTDPRESRVSWIEPEPYRDGWDGTRADLGLIVEGLLHADRQAGAGPPPSAGTPSPSAGMPSPSAGMPSSAGGGDRAPDSAESTADPQVRASAP